jgi:hypothetical protein
MSEHSSCSPLRLDYRQLRSAQYVENLGPVWGSGDLEHARHIEVTLVSIHHFGLAAECQILVRLADVSFIYPASYLSIF